jgi:dihydroxyacetone kinase
MSGTIDGKQVVAAFERAAARLLELRDQLNQLDAALGDGDTGITAAKGAVGLQEYLSANEPGDDIGKFLAGAGMAFNRTAPSTMGALVATALMSAGKEARDKAILDALLLVTMLRAADNGVQERGKAKPGDKTIVDALHPAAEAFAMALDEGQTLTNAALAMLLAAREGRDAAIPLRSKIGRAGWVGERTEGKPDPGTVMFVAILEAMLQAEPTQPGSTLST